MGSTFEELRALHRLIGTSLDFIERKFADATRIPDLDDEILGTDDEGSQYGVREGRGLYMTTSADEDRPSSRYPFDAKMRENLSNAYASPPPSPSTYAPEGPVTPPANGPRSRLSPSITRQHSSPNVHATPRHKPSSSRMDLTSYTQSSPSLLLSRAARQDSPRHQHNESISTDSLTTDPSMYSQPSQPASPVTPASPFSPMSPVDGENGFGLLDFPSLNAPMDPDSPAERMVQEADIVDAICELERR